MCRVSPSLFDDGTLDAIESSMKESGPDAVSYLGMEKAAEETIKLLWTALFPNHFNDASPSDASDTPLRQAVKALQKALTYVTDGEEEAEKEALRFFLELPEIKKNLQTDIVAAYEGDPAATGYDEIILTYPAFKAISIYRIAHQLYLQKIPILPRMMSEYGHRLTGVDIHPGAAIGDHFFIDHGTGVVIGETTTIGHHVKLYQHVTLGAKSFVVGDNGELVKGIKRHPDIGDYVVIYAGATILGGDTRIGDHCVIGGNVWLTHSVKANEKVINRTPESTHYRR